MPDRPTIVFDVNETLLDMAALDPIFTARFGDAGARTEWFQQLLLLFLTVTITDEYRPFDALGDSALGLVASRRGFPVSEDDRRAVRDGMLHLPPHADVVPAMDRLRSAGFRLAILTNSTPAMAGAQMRNAGLEPYLQSMLSADSVRRYKPSRDAYLHAATALQLPIGDIRLVAAHGWDVAGALAAGARAGFVARPGKALDPDGRRPDVVGSTMTDVVERIIEIGR